MGLKSWEELKGGAMSPEEIEAMHREADKARIRQRHRGRLDAALAKMDVPVPSQEQIDEAIGLVEGTFEEMKRETEAWALEKAKKCILITERELGAVPTKVIEARAYALMNLPEDELDELLGYG